MPADNDTTATSSAIDLDQSVESMLDTVGQARRTRDEVKAAAAASYEARTAEIDTVKRELNNQLAAKVKELDELRNNLRTELSKVTTEADDAYNVAVHGDARGPEFNQYGERIR